MRRETTVDIKNTSSDGRCYIFRVSKYIFELLRWIRALLYLRGSRLWHSQPVPVVNRHISSRYWQWLSQLFSL